MVQAHVWSHQKVMLELVGTTWHQIYRKTLEMQPKSQHHPDHCMMQQYFETALDQSQWKLQTICWQQGQKNPPRNIFHHIKKHKGSEAYIGLLQHPRWSSL